LAGGILARQGAYEGNAGNIEEALKILQKSLTLLNGSQEPSHQRLARAERGLQEVSKGFSSCNRAYDSALASLDLSAVLLAQHKAVLALKTACEVQVATRELAEKVASYVRRLENDPNARFEGEGWEGEGS
jgi:hypothetical protein